MKNMTTRQLRLLAKYKPILYLHKKEEISPLSFEEYIYNSELYNGENNTLLISCENITFPLSDEIKNLNNKYLNYVGGFVSPNYYRIKYVPYYGFVYEYKNHIDIVYIFNYFYKKSYKWFNINIGKQHQCDIKHIRIRINKQETHIIGIYFEGYNKDLGMWILNENNNIEFENNDNLKQHPIIYVSKHSHVCYPKKGKWIKSFGFMNDYTNKGIYWYPNHVINLDAHDNDLLSYNGKMDNSKKINNINREHYKIAPEIKNKNLVYRFFYPISKYIKFI